MVGKKQMILTHGSAADAKSTMFRYERQEKQQMTATLYYHYTIIENVTSRNIR